MIPYEKIIDWRNMSDEQLQEELEVYKSWDGHVEMGGGEAVDCSEEIAYLEDIISDKTKQPIPHEKIIKMSGSYSQDDVIRGTHSYLLDIQQELNSLNIGSANDKTSELIAHIKSAIDNIDRANKYT